MSEREQLVALGLMLADSLDARGEQCVGIVRRLAQAVATGTSPDADACPGCGNPIEQPTTGRRRLWCSARCRRRASAGRNADESAHWDS